MKLLLFWKLHQWLLLVPLATLKLHSACAPWLMYGPSICPKNAVVVSIRIGMYLNSDAILFYCQTRRPRVTVCSRNIIRSCVGGHFVKMMIDGIWELLWGYIIYITISACLPSDQQKSHQHVCFHWSKLHERYLKREDIWKFSTHLLNIEIKIKFFDQYFTERAFEILHVCVSYGIIWTIFWIGYEFHCGRARMEAVISAHYFSDEVLFLLFILKTAAKLCFCINTQWSW